MIAVLFAIIWGLAVFVLCSACGVHVNPEKARGALMRKRIRIVRCDCGRPDCESYFLEISGLHISAHVDRLFAPTDVSEMIEALEEFKRNGYEVKD